ncbi:MAG TPA: GGDEF domain-containing protein [Quisquiliibacterium sp.]|nr:GGDEF domain-containing protein [Quisquiliibacterium sp.]
MLGLALSVVLWRKHAVTVTLEQEVERQRAALVARQEELHFLATRDSLTGLYNRAEFINLANGELTRAARHGFETAIVVIDLDHFKVVNDTLGHPAGDRVLRSVGAVLSAELRASDVIGRLGGEEFIVLLPQTPPALARSVAEKLRARLAESTLDPESPALRITASFGVASASPQDGSADFEAIYQRADAALYRAKGDGRNRVCVADAGQPGA